MPLFQDFPPEQSRAQMLLAPTDRQDAVAVPPGEGPQEAGLPAGEHSEVQAPSVSSPLTMHTKSSVHWGVEVQCDHQPVFGCGGRTSPPELESSAPLDELEPDVSSPPLEVVSPPEVEPPEVASSSVSPPSPVLPSPSLSPVGASVVHAPVVSRALPPAQPTSTAVQRNQRRIARLQHISCRASGAPRGNHSARLRACDW